MLIGLGSGRLAAAAGEAEPGEADAEQRERRRLRHRSRCQVAEDKDQIVVVPVASLRPGQIFPADDRKRRRWIRRQEVVDGSARLPQPSVPSLKTAYCVLQLATLLQVPV